jgi:hypothetical protein
MKNRIKYNILFILILSLFISELRGQGHYLLDHLSLTEINGKVQISLTMSSGNTCNGIRFYRSEDSINFVEIGQIYGVCGLIDAPANYSFIDEQPILNKKSYYKVELGNEGFSDVLSIEIINTSEFGFHVRPNPATDKAIIYFENPYQEKFQLQLISNTGKLMAELQTNSNAFELDLTALPSGLYYFLIYRNEVFIGKKGKLIVSK